MILTFENEPYAHRPATLTGKRVDIIPSIYGFQAGLIEGPGYVKMTHSKLRAAWWILRYGNGEAHVNRSGFSSNCN